MDDVKCPRCSESEDIIVSNVDGYECEKCNAWFDIDDGDGDIIFAYDHFPGLIL